MNVLMGFRAWAALMILIGVLGGMLVVVGITFFRIQTPSGGVRAVRIVAAPIQAATRPSTTLQALQPTRSSQNQLPTLATQPIKPQSAVITATDRNDKRHTSPSRCHPLTTSLLPDTRYLGFCHTGGVNPPHDIGFGNRLVILQNMAWLARKTNRTLLLPHFYFACERWEDVFDLPTFVEYLQQQHPWENPHIQPFTRSETLVLSPSKIPLHASYPSKRWLQWFNASLQHLVYPRPIHPCCFAVDDFLCLAGSHPMTAKATRAALHCTPTKCTNCVFQAAGARPRLPSLLMLLQKIQNQSAGLVVVEGYTAYLLRFLLTDEKLGGIGIGRIEPSELPAMHFSTMVYTAAERILRHLRPLQAVYLKRSNRTSVVCAWHLRTYFTTTATSIRAASDHDHPKNDETAQAHGSGNDAQLKLARAVDRIALVLRSSQCSAVFVMTNARAAEHQTVIRSALTTATTTSPSSDSDRGMANVMIGCPSEIEELCRTGTPAQVIAVEQLVSTLADVFIPEPSSSFSACVQLRRFQYGKPILNLDHHRSSSNHVVSLGTTKGAEDLQDVYLHQVEERQAWIRRLMVWRIRQQQQSHQ